MATADGDRWELTGPDGTLYGRLVAPEHDMFDVFARFQAEPAFTALAPLFAEVWRCRDAMAAGGDDAEAAWEAAYERVAALQLTLRPPGGTRPVSEFLLHINPSTGEASFRYLD
jgi:hypothetical protein